MKAGIIAAGDGSRLVAGGIPTPKPLVTVGGMSLMERTLRGLVAAGVDEITFIVNEHMVEVVEHCQRLSLGIPLHPVIRTTESSMHSLYHLGQHLSGERFVLCTVDSILLPTELEGFVQCFASQREVGLLLAYTDFVDDEKPLRIAIGEGSEVQSIGPQAESSPFVTAGLYGMSPEIFGVLEGAVRSGLQRLRNFLGLLLERGILARGYRLTKAVDVDRPEDIEVAQRFLLDHQQGDS